MTGEQIILFVLYFSLTSGFVIKANGSVIPAVSVDLPLVDLIEATEDPPMRFAFSIQLQSMFYIM